MAKVIDITDKLNFEELPKLKIKDVELQVNSDAGTMLKVMQAISENEGMGPAVLLKIYQLVFPEEEQRVIQKMNVCGFEGLRTIITSAVELVTGASFEDADQGEQ